MSEQLQIVTVKPLIEVNKLITNNQFVNYNVISKTDREREKERKKLKAKLFRNQIKPVSTLCIKKK